jgi:ring-1,2-phenylacetyl-CoA epoxidase subunit PaaB
MLPHPQLGEPDEPDQGAGHDRGPALEPFEVFRQEREGEPMRHGGSVVAPDPTLALHYARELYARRGESLRLWVVRRADIVELDDQDLLNPPLDRSYKKPGGYVMRDKLAQARERTGQVKRTASTGRPAQPPPKPTAPSSPSASGDAEDPS